jgi:murein DD-endopeptidase MepM/ murein hydrolase activator NlpD
VAQIGAVVLVLAIVAALAFYGIGGGSRPAVALSTGAPSAAALAADPTGAPTASPSPTTPPPATLTGYRWPLDHGRITTPFGVVTAGTLVVDGQPFHDGIDIASFCGDHIEAAHDGVVIATGRHVNAALGWVGNVAAYEARLDAKKLWNTLAITIVIDDGNGYRSEYIHLYKSLVKTGQHVKAGDVIGYEGRTGLATGCHLHYSIFSPTDRRRFQVSPTLVTKELLPAEEIARVDPLSILPPMSTTSLTWGWNAEPSPSASTAP